MQYHALLPVVLVCSSLPAQADPLPAVGKPAPVVQVEDHLGKPVTIGGKSDTWTVLAFYPKAMTGG